MKTHFTSHDWTHQPIAPERFFVERYVVAQNAPYLLATADRKPDSGGGVLRGGQVVWLEHTLDRKNSPSKVLGFAEGLGLMYLEPMWLRRPPLAAARPNQVDPFGKEIV